MTDNEGGATMADRKKQTKKTTQQRGRASPRQAPKMKVIESGRAEQEAPIETAGKEPSGPRPAKKEVAREKERQEYRYGGIPIGSDPRE